MIAILDQIDLLSEKALEAVNLRGDDLADNCLKALRKKGATFDDEFIESLASGKQQEDPDIEAFRQQVCHWTLIAESYSFKKQSYVYLPLFYQDNRHET